MSRMGDTIRSARVKAKMTEKTLGKKCGMAENVIKDIEAGRRIVSDDQAQRILKILGVKNPISEELEVAAEPDVPLRPRPRPYKLPTTEIYTSLFVGSVRLCIRDSSLDISRRLFTTLVLSSKCAIIP